MRARLNLAGAALKIERWIMRIRKGEWLLPGFARPGVSSGCHKTDWAIPPGTLWGWQHGWENDRRDGEARGVKKGVFKGNLITFALRQKIKLETRRELDERPSRTRSR